MKIKILVILFLFTYNVIAGIGVGFSSVGALPVEITTFIATVTNDNIQLNWVTVTEVDNYGFYVERNSVSLNGTGKRFLESLCNWVQIGFVNGHGNSNSPKEYSFVDKSVFPGLYQYRLKQVDTDGGFIYSKVIEVRFDYTPKDYKLEQNYPNPFNPITIISYSIPTASNVTLKVFDVLGNFIATLVDQKQVAGSYKINFDGSELSNGVYIYKIQTGNFIAVKKMSLLK